MRTRSLFSWSKRTAVTVSFVLLVGALLGWTSVSRRHQSVSGLSGSRAKRGGTTYVYEVDTHDEVTGAIGASLAIAGIRPIFACFFRFEFEKVLESIMGYMPPIENPRTSNREIDRRLAEDSIDNLILTTCTTSLKQLHAAILASSVNVICIVHHSGPSLYHDVRPLIKPLIDQGRIQLVTLGGHVTRNARLEALDWSAMEHWDGWERLHIDTLLPVFDYPPNPARADPAVFPSHVVIQGNVEPSRRKYKEIFQEVKEAMLGSPALWGYDSHGVDRPLIPQEALSPFQIHLVGQRNPKNPVEVPVELQHVVKFHESLPYPDFYSLMAGCDMLLPAFAQAYVLIDTASSSIAAGVIAGIPVLVNPRQHNSYEYLDGPAVMAKNMSSTEAQSIAELRRTGRKPRASSDIWRKYKMSLQTQNAMMWDRVLR